MNALFLIVCFAAITLVGLLLGFAIPMIRSKRLERTARELGFRYSERGTPFENSQVAGLAILPDGASTVVSNLLERECGSCRYVICDISDAPLGQESAPLITTISALHAELVHPPIFQIDESTAAQRAIEQVEQALRKKPSGFRLDETFARQFVVHCPEVETVQSFLTPAKLAYLRDHAAHYHVESSRDWLLIYRPGWEVGAKNLKEFSEVTSALASVLLFTRNEQSPAAA